MDRPFERVPVVEPNMQRPGALPASNTDSWKAINKLWAAKGEVWRDPTSGDFAASKQGEAWRQVKRPRIGLYQSFIPAMDEGWTRWLLEQFGFAYESLRNSGVQEGGLRQRFDVIVFPDQGASQILNGYRKGAMPPEYAGGIGAKGVAALKEFAQTGGTLVFLNKSSEFALEQLGVKAKDVTSGVSNREYYSPGSLLNVKLDPKSPLCYGAPAELAIWSEHSPAWDIADGSVAKFPASKILASGWLLGEKLLAGTTALADVKYGSGHVILFGMRPQYRAQSYATFKLFFNALVY
jgi:hypothetical protein